MQGSPYYDYVAVRDRSMFFGRREELQKIYNAIDKRQCISLVGTRKIGKSSLLKFLSSPDLQKRYNFDLSDRIFILTDLREYADKTREDFFQAVSADLLAQSRSYVALQAPDAVDGQSRLKKLLQDIRNAGFRPVLLMDAFDKVTKNTHFDPNFFSFLRALAGVYDLISFITASIKPLYEVSHSDDVASSPFFNIFQTLRLGPLAREEAKELITVPAERTGHPFTPKEVEWLLARAGRHPFFLQVACRQLFEAKRGHEPEEIDLEMVQERIYQELLPHFEATWKEDLNVEQRQQLQQGIIQSQPMKSRMPELSESLLFRKKVRTFLVAHPVEIQARDVKDALDNFDDNNYLNECTISKMHYIATLSTSNQAMNADRRSTQVRDFLKVAFERLRPGEIRNDTSPEWRAYNILWYHYFKYNLPNQRTAARLGIASMRQFYREQEKALQLLLAEMLEMEIASIREKEE